MIGRLLGHSKVGTTASYAHLVHDHREGRRRPHRRQHRRPSRAASRRGGVRPDVMAILQYRALSSRTVAALAVERDTVFWDREFTGFGVRNFAKAKTSQ